MKVFSICPYCGVKFIYDQETKEKIYQDYRGSVIPRNCNHFSTVHGYEGEDFTGITYQLILTTTMPVYPVD